MPFNFNKIQFPMLLKNMFQVAKQTQIRNKKFSEQQRYNEISRSQKNDLIKINPIIAQNEENFNLLDKKNPQNTAPLKKNIAPAPSMKKSKKPNPLPSIENQSKGRFIDLSE